MYGFFRNIHEKKNEICFSSVGENTRDISYGEYYNDVCECLERIVEKSSDISGKHVGLLADNSYEYIVALGALFMGRAIVVPINAYEAEDNINYILENADVEVLIRSEKYGQYGSKATLSILEITEHSNNKQYDYYDNIDSCIDETMLLIYTSGTTGKPKGVIQPLSYFVNFYERNSAYYSDITSCINRMYITVPLYHVMGLYYWLLSFRCGCVMYLSSEIGSILFELKRICPDLIIATPAVLRLLEIATKKNKENGLDNLKYIVSGGAELSKQLVEKLWEKGIKCFNAYGMTETAGAGTFNRDTIHHLDSIGTPTPNTEIRIFDGEICISCESLMKGYYKDEVATTECLIGGYIHTGDLGYIDKEGYVYITGRKKNLIILSGGENVSPEELESKLYGCPLIKECIVYEKNDRIVADIYAPGTSEEEIKEYVDELNNNLPIFKRIYSFEIKNNELEKTANGKIKRWNKPNNMNN